MKTINKRLLLIIIITAVFLSVTALLMFSMFSHAEEYALKSINAHLYDSGTLISAGDIVDENGIKLAYTENGERKYADNSAARAALLHIIGDDAGFIDGGIQDSFSKELCGYNIIYGVNKNSGNTLNLTLDSELCASAYNKIYPYKGCVAVCNYKTGEIVCLATSPSYDVYNVPGDLSDEEKYEGVYINRLFRGLYTPGSTFKTVTALGAIENIDDIYNQTFYCSGSYSVGGGEIICNDTHGTVTFKQALNQSCNVAFAQITIQLGEEKLNDAFRTAGLDKSHDTVDRLHTISGRSPVSDSISTYELGWAGVGQSTTLVNPYAFLNFMCAVANGGKAYEPYFVKSAVSDSGRAVYTAKPVDSGISIKASTAATLKELLRSTVSDYYGDYMFGDVTMCGKTGTAEIDNKDPHSWFVGFSYDDSFPYAIVTVIENRGSGLKYAGNVSAEIMNELYNNS